MDWIKKNWLIVLVGVVVLALAWKQHHSSSLYDKLMEDYNHQNLAHEELVKNLEKVNADQLKKQQQLNNEFQAHIDRIEKNFNQRIDKINNDRKKQQVKLVEIAKKDPTALLKAIKDTFGIPIYEKQGGEKHEKK